MRNARRHRHASAPVPGVTETKRDLGKDRHGCMACGHCKSAKPSARERRSCVMLSCTERGQIPNESNSSHHTNYKVSVQSERVTSLPSSAVRPNYKVSVQSERVTSLPSSAVRPMAIGIGASAGDGLVRFKKKERKTPTARVEPSGPFSST
jgi:hypothetical protein